MTWRMKHKLFGWDYIVLYGSTIPCRIRIDGEGRPYVVKVGNFQRIDRDPAIHFWLTCPPSKYIKGEPT